MRALHLSLRRGAAAAVALLAVAAAGACSDDTGLPTLDAEPDDFPVAVTVELDDDGFRPTAIEVAPGELVRLVNVGDERHRPATTGAQGHDSGDLLPGEDTTWIFDEPGSHELVDRRRPDGAPGRIVVADPADPEA